MNLFGFAKAAKEQPFFNNKVDIKLDCNTNQIVTQKKYSITMEYTIMLCPSGGPT